MSQFGPPPAPPSMSDGLRRSLGRFAFWARIVAVWYAVSTALAVFFGGLDLVNTFAGGSVGLSSCTMIAFLLNAAMGGAMAISLWRGVQRFKQAAGVRDRDREDQLLATGMENLKLFFLIQAVLYACIFVLLLSGLAFFGVGSLMNALG